VTLRLGLGPVFAYEWLRASRRWQLYGARVLFVGALLIALGVVYWSQTVDRPLQLSIRNQAAVGEKFFYAIIGTQLALVLLAAPAAAAGAFCHDKASGSLAHLFVTDLSNLEIVLGKLAARLVPVLGLVGCSLPILALSTLFGGIDPDALTAAFLITLGAGVLGCTVALTLSIWGSQTHEVLLGSYLLWTVLLLVYPVWELCDSYWQQTTVPPWLPDTNQFYLAFDPYLYPGTSNWKQVKVFLGVTLGASALLVAVAILRIRAVTLKQISRPERRRASLRRFHIWRLLLTPSLNRNPILWREYHRKRPSRWSLAIWTIYVLGAAACTVLAISQAVGGPGRETAPLVNAFQVSIGLLLLSVSAVTALAEERVRGSLDVVLTTPLSTATIVWGKWWGTYRRVPLLAVLPVLLAVTLAARSMERGPVLLLVCLILAMGAAITSLGLALATWIPRLGRAVGVNVGVYVLAAVGPLCLMLLFRDGSDRWAGLTEVSPWFGPGELTFLMSEPGSWRRDKEPLHWAWFWIAAYAGVAVALLAATFLSFNHCLGRMTASHKMGSCAHPQQPTRRSRR
jgi:ABC-type transport system involved in multi-copper enzyme maturation permease subunit